MPNVFRPEYRELSEKEKTLIDDIKTKAEELYNLIDGSVNVSPSPQARYASLAKTSLEESIMWAVKGITS